jgi:aminoglycoside phosphotransferase (APT) family kinase protein
MDDDVARAALAGWLERRLAESGTAAAAVRVGPFERPGAGQSNDTLTFSAQWQVGGTATAAELVLRKHPADNQLFDDADVLREFRVLRGLSGTGVPAPRALWAEPDPAVIGAPFFVMTRASGRVPFGKPSIHQVGWLPELTPAERRRLWEAAMSALVAVHDVDWETTHAFLPGAADPGNPIDAHLARLQRWYGWVVGEREFPTTDAALEHLVARRPRLSPADRVLVWGDARIGNMVFAANLGVAAVIDWEIASIGPAGVDLGHWLFFDEFLTTASGVRRLHGFPDRDETVARYESLSGRRCEDVDYFVLLQAFFIAVTLIRQADLRVRDGKLSPGTRMGHDNAVTQLIARRLGLPVPELGADYLAHRQSR